MRITRDKALVIADYACRRYETKVHEAAGGTVITLPDDYSTTDWPYDAIVTASGHLLISKRPPWPIGVPYHHNTSGKTWLR